MRMKATSALVLVAEEAVPVRGAGESLEESRREFDAEEVLLDGLAEGAEKIELQAYTAQDTGGAWQEPEEES